GGVSQTICTTGITCASGGGQAVILAPGSAQTNSSATDSSIFINNTGAANILQLQSSGVDALTLDASGVLTLGTVNSLGGSIVFADGTSNHTVKLNVDSLTGNRTFSFPNTGSGDICISTGNCAGAG